MAVNNQRLLVVDDEDSIREVLTDFLTMEGYNVTSCSNGTDAKILLQRERFDAILLDLKMPGMNGIELLKFVQTDAPHTLPIMMTGYGTVETAIEAMKSGAYDYILKPFKVQDVILLLERGLAKQQLERENIQLREAVALYDRSEDMATSLELSHIYDVLIDTTRGQVNADGVSIWTRDDRGHVECMRRWMRGNLESRHARVMASIDWDAVSAREAAGLPLVLHDHHARSVVDDVENESLMSLLCVPLKTQDRTLGFLFAFAFEPREDFQEGKRKMLTVLAGRASGAVENAKLYRNLKTTFKQTIQAFANLLEDKDPYTHGHSHRVSTYAVLIAEGLALPADEVELIADCALMHDIGKLGIRYEDLNKAEPLTESEYEMFKSHTTRGKWILEPIAFLHDLIPGVYHHHERWDGKGYPMGLAGEDIPLHGRILAIADTYDAMTSHRAYRRALSHDVAIREIQAFAGTQFDPDLVDVFVREISHDKRSQKAKAQRWNALAEEATDYERDNNASGFPMDEPALTSESQP